MKVEPGWFRTSLLPAIHDLRDTGTSLAAYEVDPLECSRCGDTLRIIPSKDITLIFAT